METIFFYLPCPFRTAFSKNRKREISLINFRYIENTKLYNWNKKINREINFDKTTADSSSDLSEYIIIIIHSS